MGTGMTGRRFTVNCDNEAVVNVVNKGAAKDKILLQWLRELARECALAQCEMVTVFLPGVMNRIPDILFRIPINRKFKQQFDELKQEH